MKKIHKKISQKSPSNQAKHGYLHVYTGAGKGKTSAALGVLLRAAGHGQRVLMIQFLKGEKDRGELLAVQKLGNNIEILQFGRVDLESLEALQAADAYFAGQGLNYAREAMRSRRRRPDVVILDEIMTALDKELIRVEDIIDVLDNRHRNIEVILTGAGAHPALLNMADLVTVFQPAKHYFSREDFSPRLGIEY